MATIYFDTMAVYKGNYYPAKTNIEVKDSELNELRESGAHIVGEPRTKKKVDVTELVTKKVDELVRFAKTNGIDLGNATKKADIFNIIVSYLQEH